VYVCVCVVCLCLERYIVIRRGRIIMGDIYGGNGGRSVGNFFIV
jgi:hypothetical protein